MMTYRPVVIEAAISPFRADAPVDAAEGVVDEALAVIACGGVRSCTTITMPGSTRRRDRRPDRA